VHAAALIVGDVGTLRFAENRVEASQNGLIVSATRWIPTIAFLSPARVVTIFSALARANTPPEANQQWDAVQASTELVTSMLFPRNAIVASALMSIPLPDSLEKDPSLIPLAGVVDDNQWPAAVASLAAQVFPFAQSILNLPGTFGHRQLTAEIAQRVSALWGNPDPLSLLIDPVVAALGFAPIEKLRRSTNMSVDCGNNVLEVRSLTGDQTLGTGLLIMDAPGPDQRSYALLHGNHISNRSSILPAATVAFVARSEMTGALVLNETTLGPNDPLQEFWSLVMFPSPNPVGPDGNGPPMIAVTGNVFKGWPVLPRRPIAVNDPFDRWLFLNTVSF